MLSRACAFARCPDPRVTRKPHSPHRFTRLSVCALDASAVREGAL